jgi:hypothetical protein
LRSFEPACTLLTDRIDEDLPADHNDMRHSPIE